MCFQAASDELREWESFKCFAQRHEQEKDSALCQVKNKKMKICSKCDTNALSESVSVEALKSCQEHVLCSNTSTNATGDSLLVLPTSRNPKPNKPAQLPPSASDQLRLYQFQAYCQQLARSFPHYAAALNTQLWCSKFGLGAFGGSQSEVDRVRAVSDASRSGLSGSCSVQKPAKV
eukprot:TRINITY_DN3172_c0_g2_i2.p1 TRINITY_DN3172_c0_g2~~TRINITY_DN3172_c0_g2_i2.p1  ORF type:complete len:176 (+),score=28.04 TRINITY_DN3172_c0_g2_i2:179-706(+)